MHPSEFHNKWVMEHIIVSATQHFMISNENLFDSCHIVDGSPPFFRLRVRLYQKMYLFPLHHAKADTVIVVAVADPTVRAHAIETLRAFGIVHSRKNCVNATYRLHSGFSVI